jgi:hypothetical protein
MNTRKSIIPFLLVIMATLLIAPLADAVQKISSRTPVGSKLRSAEWEREPLALRERAQFSAGVEEVRVLHTIQDGLGKLIGQIRSDKGAFTDRSKIIAEIGKVARDAGLTPKDPKLIGSIQDITSERRAELIVDTQTQMAYGFTNWKTGQDPDMLDAFPAQELIRVEERVDKRDWRRRWVEAGGKIVQGRMVARKTDPIWENLSRFGTPWPPYDFNSGMGVEDVSREEALELGLIEPKESIPPTAADFNQKLEVTKSGIGESGWQRLKAQFGDQIRFDGDQVKWHGTIIQELYERALSEPTFQAQTRLGAATSKAVREAAKLNVDLQDAELRLTADDIRHAHTRHGQESDRSAARSIVRLDFEMVPQVWRDPDSVVRGTGDALIFRKEFAGTLHTVVWKRSQEDSGKKVFGIKTLYKSKPA